MLNRKPGRLVGKFGGFGRPQPLGKFYTALNKRIMCKLSAGTIELPLQFDSFRFLHWLVNEFRCEQHSSFGSYKPSDSSQDSESDDELFAHLSLDFEK